VRRALYVGSTQSNGRADVDFSRLEYVGPILKGGQRASQPGANRFSPIEYVDTQALARASEMDASPRFSHIDIDTGAAQRAS
jgi:hypothetical protein